MSSPWLGNSIAQILIWLYRGHFGYFWQYVPLGGDIRARVYFVRRLFPSWAVGQTWGDYVLIQGLYEHDSILPALLTHEYVHVWQWHREGLWGLGFLAKYLWCYFRAGFSYSGNRMEIEANTFESSITS